MSGFKIAICDDDQYMIAKVHEFLKLYFSRQRILVNIQFFNDGKYLLDSNEKFDIIILDIDMKIIGGIEVKDDLFFDGVSSKIIFLTNYSERIKEAMGRNVYGLVSKDDIHELEKYLDKIVYEYKNFQIITITGKVIDIFDIVYIHSSGGYCYFHYKDGDEEIFRILLNEVELLLAEHEHFVRVHQSYIVNLNYIQKIVSKDLIFKSGVYENLSIHISRKYADEVVKRYFHYRKERCRNG